MMDDNNFDKINKSLKSLWILYVFFFFFPEFFYLEQSWQNAAQIASTSQIENSLRIHSECVCFSHDCVTSAPKVGDSTHAF